MSLRVLLAGLAVWLCATAAPGWAASPADPVRQRFAGDFQAAMDGYARLGAEAGANAAKGLKPLDATWDGRMKVVDRLLVQHESVFFPMMTRPWSREAAVFSNLQGARMWLWSIHDGLRDGAAGVKTLDVVDGRVRDELLANFTAYLEKAHSLMAGGEFKGSYFADTHTPVLADYCAYPEDGKRVRPDFKDQNIFKQSPAGQSARNGGGGVQMRPVVASTGGF
ncbi:MAG: hypothetical protein OEW11_04825 [Nitrospirota bacterium]|nr:hypothetical protein [Nitrospirota bacterium]